MTSLATAGVVVGLLCTAASAADLPAKAPVYTKAPAVVPLSWTGFYVGAGVGIRSSQVDGDVTAADVTGPGGANLISQVCGVGFSCVGEPLNNTAFRISPYFGYNYQFATQWLAGIEGDWGFGDKTTNLAGMNYPTSNPVFSQAIAPAPGHADSFSVKTGWDASARARIGFLVTPDFLLYATGGAAWQRVEATSTCQTLCFIGFVPSVITDSTTKLGYTVGGGIETMLWRNWIVRGEYRYADYGTVSFTDVRTFAPANSLIVTDALKLKTQTATFGVAYKFSP
jgi:outer membrane immunogenic protein